MPDISFKNQQAREFIEKFLVVIILDYVGLFAAETVLPGFVMNVFNLNYLLLAILAMVAYLVLAPAPVEEGKVANQKEKGSPASYAAGLLIAGAAVVALYKVSGWQIALYVALAIMAGAALYRALTTEDV